MIPVIYASIAVCCLIGLAWYVNNHGDPFDAIRGNPDAERSVTDSAVMGFIVGCFVVAIVTAWVLVVAT